MPLTGIMPAANPNWIGSADYAFPQGRNVTGYQFVDDLSWTKGKHTFKFGYTFRRDDITDYTPSEHNITLTAGPENFVLDQGDFAAGYSDECGESASRSSLSPAGRALRDGLLWARSVEGHAESHR